MNYPGLIRVLCIGGAAVAMLASAPSESVAEAARPAAPSMLFNGRDLGGWVVVPASAETGSDKTWSVRGGVLTATGTPNGYVRTDKAYRDYALRVEWRWVPGDVPLNAEGRPRGRNSGVLLHAQAEEKVWPRCLEAQLAAGNAGDFIALEGVVFSELLAARETAQKQAGEDTEARQRAAGLRRLARHHDSSEKPVGEWNVYEIVCRGDTVSLTVNGVLQNTATGVSVREGHIALQSEGVPIEFRRIELTPLN